MVAIIILSDVVTGYYMGIIFMFNHFLEDVTEKAHESLMEHTMKTTVNITSNRWITYLLGGLNYQIEHHLITHAPIYQLYNINTYTRQHAMYREYTLSYMARMIHHRLMHISMLAYAKHATAFELVCASILRAMGWRIINDDITIPERCIMLGYPHTSYFDFVLFYLYFNAIKCGSSRGLRFLISSKFDRPILRHIIRHIGGVFVNHKNKQVDDLLSLIRVEGAIRLHIPPEGTTKQMDCVRTGFYVLGMKTKLPIMAFALDAKTRTLSRLPPILLTGHVEDDILPLQRFYDDKRGINDRNRTPFVMKSFQYVG